MSIFRRTAFTASLVAITGMAQAVEPIVSGLTPGDSFEDFSGSTAVGNGLVDVNQVLWYIDEAQVVGFKSYYIFFEPKNPETVDATLTFEGPISAVLTTKSALDGSNATYGNASINYTTSRFIGLEPGQDSVSWAGNKLTLHFAAEDPGDHIRVLIAVPEPSTWALFGAGIAALGFVGRRRQNRRS